MIEIQKDFQRQVIILKNELEDEKQARIRLEAEVTYIFLIHDNSFKSIMFYCRSGL